WPTSLLVLLSLSLEAPRQLRFWWERDMIARKWTSHRKSSACFSRIVAPGAQLEEGNHEHTDQRCSCTEPGKENFRSIRSATHALTWAQPHPCASRLASSGHLARGYLSCQAPGILYSTQDRLHRRCVWFCTTHP